MERCQMNPKTKKQFQCGDCKFRDTCIEDILNDLQEKFIKAASQTGKEIGKLLKERGGI